MLEHDFPIYSRWPLLESLPLEGQVHTHLTNSLYKNYNEPFLYVTARLSNNAFNMISLNCDIFLLLGRGQS